MTIETVLKEYHKLIWHVIFIFVKSNNIPNNHAEDIFQEVSIRLNTKLPSFDPSLSSIKTFVVSNTEIVCMRYRREFFRSNSLELENVENIRQEPPFEEMTKLIDDYQTTECNRKIIHRKLEGYTQKEIAVQFAISQSTVSRVLSEFRDYLLEEIEK